MKERPLQKVEAGCGGALGSKLITNSSLHMHKGLLSPL